MLGPNSSPRSTNAIVTPYWSSAALVQSGPKPLITAPNLASHFRCSIFRNMSIYKSDQIERLAQVFKALSNPHRLRMYLRLASACEPGCCDDAEKQSCVGDLGGELGLAQSTLSHHLKELHRAGLIQMDRHGKFVMCCVNEDVHAELMQLFTLGDTP
jgi:ArsR family transcriptional regulator, arsenate/arsenite/antimonite-responsive transcriptional repressor